MTRRRLNVFRMEQMEPRRLLAATIIRVDVGGDGHVEASGKTWGPDRRFTAGTVAGGGGAVAGTEEDAMFDSRRFGNFSYSLPIKNGQYRVKFLFNDPVHSSAGQRTFDVFAEKRLILDDFDIARWAGGSNTALVKTAKVTVRDSRLNLWFQNVIDNAIVSAIEVTPLLPSLSWTAAAKAPLPRFEAQGEVIGENLYVFGGFQTDDITTTARAHVFNATTGTWSELARMPVPLSHAGTAVDSAFIYFAGGFVGDWMGSNTPATRDVFRYDTVTNTWAKMLPLPEARGAGALVRVGRKLHFFGGMDSNFNDRAEHWTLDLRRPNVWRPNTPLPSPRNHLGYALAGTKIYAIGGQKKLDEASGNVADVHAFDVMTGQWSQVASLPQPRSHIHNSTVVLGGNRVLVVGGATNGMHTMTDLLEYDPLTNGWRFIGHMPGARQAAVAKVLAGRIIVTGGTTSEISPTTDTWIS